MLFVFFGLRRSTGHRQPRARASWLSRAASPMASIRRLSSHEASRLRCDCALPRLASIVEELVLNALDAEATDVRVALDISTCTVSVRDNGVGIGKESLRVVGERHTTSKLRTLADLEGDGLTTFGFRGEALHLIAAIAHLEIISCSAATPTATQALVLHHGVRHALGPASEARAVGTTVTARDCFSNRPVARKQLVSRPGAVQAELEVVRRRLAALAISHPFVSFRLQDVDRNLSVLSTPRTSSSLASLRQCMGAVPLPAMAEVCFHADDCGLAVEGYMAVPPTSHHGRDCQYIFLNRRPLARRSDLHRLLESALDKLSAACRSLSGPLSHATPSGPVSHATPPASNHPAFVLFLRCPPSHFDLTLEPDKSEAIFSDGGRAAASFLLSAISAVCSSHSADLDKRTVAHLLEPLLPATERGMSALGMPPAWLGKKESGDASGTTRARNVGSAGASAPGGAERSDVCDSRGGGGTEAPWLAIAVGEAAVMLSSGVQHRPLRATSVSSLALHDGPSDSSIRSSSERGAQQLARWPIQQGKRQGVRSPPSVRRATKRTAATAGSHPFLREDSGASTKPSHPEWRSHESKLGAPDLGLDSGDPRAEVHSPALHRLFEPSMPWESLSDWPDERNQTVRPNQRRGHGVPPSSSAPSISRRSGHRLKQSTGAYPPEGGRLSTAREAAPAAISRALSHADINSEHVVDRASLQGLNALAQIERKFIIATSGSTLFAIDQHAADERVQVRPLSIQRGSSLHPSHPS